MAPRKSNLQEEHEECHSGDEIMPLPGGSVRSVRHAPLFGRPRPPPFPLPAEGQHLCEAMKANGKVCGERHARAKHDCLDTSLAKDSS